MKKKILIITPNPLHNGPRLIREIDALKFDYDITAIGASPPHDPTIDFIPYQTVNFGLLDRLIRKFYNHILKKPYFKCLPIALKRIHKVLDDLNPDIVIVHNPIHLPYFFSYKQKKIKIVYNAHEYHPLEFEHNPKWLRLQGQVYHKLYQNYLHKCDLVINVCDGIAAKCKEVFNVDSLVIPNAALYFNGTFREKFDANPVRFIHHGGTNSDRKIEVMIEAFRELGAGYELDLMLVNNQKEYYSFLQKEVQQTLNVRLINPVAFNDIIPLLTSYHAGVYVLPPVSFNNTFALPNKFFEFIQARIPVVTGPSIEMKKIIEKYNIGVVTKDFTSMALVESIRNLSTEQMKIYQQNTDIAAKELSAESYQNIFKKAIDAIH